MNRVCDKRQHIRTLFISLTSIIWCALVAGAAQEPYDINLKELHLPPVGRAKTLRPQLTDTATNSPSQSARRKSKPAPQPKSAAVQPHAADTHHEREVVATTVQPCLLAREAAEHLGVQAADFSPFIGKESVSVAYDVMKIVVTCGLAPDEAYTLKRLLTRQGVKMLSFKADEAPRTVIEGLFGSLGITFHLSNTVTGAGLPLTYFFPAAVAGDDLRLTIRPDTLASK